MTKTEKTRGFVTLVTIAADTPEQLRRCDVYRVVEAAKDAGMAGFTGWLKAKRPDLADEIAEAANA